MRWWLAFSLNALVACTCTTDAQQHDYACSSDADCTGGFACVGQRCIESGNGGGSAATGGGSSAQGGGSAAGGGGASTLGGGTSTGGGTGTGGGGGATNDAGQQNGSACDAGSACASTYCVGAVCCDGPCVGACATCGTGACQAKAHGNAGSPACAPYACNGAAMTCPSACAGPLDCTTPAFCSVQSTCLQSNLPVGFNAPTLTSNGSTVTANDGTWQASNGGAITTTHRWLRCSADGGNCQPLTAPGFFTGSNLQTDATRAAATQGDGLPLESSVGTWGASTNLGPNGGLESSLNLWSTFSSGTQANNPAFVRDTTQHKFGTASVKVTTNGLDPHQSGVENVVVVTGNTTYTASAWVKAAPGAVLCIRVDELDNTPAYLTSFSGSQATLMDGGWQHLSLTGTTASQAVTAHLLAGTCTSLGQAVTFGIDGMQLEQSPSASPYVETNGTTATRQSSSIVGPISLLSLANGWAAFRARPEWTAATANQVYPTLLEAPLTVTNKLHLYYSTQVGVWVLERNNGVQNQLTVAHAETPGLADTIVAAWTPTQQMLSVNGAAFATLNASQIPSGVPEIDLGSLDGELSWVAFGDGTLDDATAAKLHAFGDTDPTFSTLPSSATMLWTADTLQYSAAVLNVPSYALDGGYSGSTLRLQVTATNSNGSTVATSAPLPLP